jgi:hypothetical protein
VGIGAVESTGGGGVSAARAPGRSAGEPHGKRQRIGSNFQPFNAERSMRSWSSAPHSTGTGPPGRVLLASPHIDSAFELKTRIKKNIN